METLTAAVRIVAPVVNTTTPIPIMNKRPKWSEKRPAKNGSNNSPDDKKNHDIALFSSGGVVLSWVIAGIATPVLDCSQNNS
jgi:hypothetical protein